MTNNIGVVPGEKVEHTTSIGDICRHRVRPYRRRRSEPPLLVPRHVVLLCKLFREITEILEAESRPAVQQQNSRPAAGTPARDTCSVVLRRELDPHHSPGSSHSGDLIASAQVTFPRIDPGCGPRP